MHPGLQLRPKWIGLTRDQNSRSLALGQNQNVTSAGFNLRALLQPSASSLLSFVLSFLLPTPSNFHSLTHSLWLLARCSCHGASSLLPTPVLLGRCFEAPTTTKVWLPSQSPLLLPHCGCCLPIRGSLLFLV